MDQLGERQQAARDGIVQALMAELLGPSEGEDEEIQERPTLRYLVGRLAPVGTDVSPEEDDAAADEAGEEDGGVDRTAPISMSMSPSSIGLSVLVAPDETGILVTAAWGQYTRESRPYTDQATGKAGERTVYVRTPVAGTHVIPLGNGGGRDRKPLSDEVRLEWVVRQLADGRSAVSVFLVNRNTPDDPRRPDDTKWLFQPTLTLSGTADAPAFVARRLEDIGGAAGDPDLQSAELLYWSRPEFATGHGCAATWEADPGDARRARQVWSEILPSYELPRIDPLESSPATLDMRALGGDGPDGVSPGRLREMLEPLVTDYKSWIQDVAQRTDSLPAELQDVADEHVQRCRMAQKRISDGIEIVCGDAAVRKAFCFANRAMALQREHSVRSLARRRGEKFPTQVTVRWRPFQLAFILLNLPSLADRRHRDRSVADLLWFPTGGGKTEAYLGLTAFALAYRRLRPPQDGYLTGAGVTVLMRYTLRLLTLQQFQRATALICACERLRTVEGGFGARPFSIGLWVGQSATPNDYEDAKEALERVRNGLRPYRGTPYQLVSCPWCGADLGVEDYRADDADQRIYITCSDDTCDFAPTRSKGLPVHLVDEEVYRWVPSLVIATVDKFARMPWNGRVMALFGRVNRFCARHGYLTAADKHEKKHRAGVGLRETVVVDVPSLEPPDLIIQDELHLISGPLGTMVGLYETAVDALASVRVGDDTFSVPKVIASTATIRRADEQVARLFVRGIQIFPPSGLDAGDSYFAREVETGREPGRLYVGVHAPGKSVKTALVRVYANLLARAQAERQSAAEIGDTYMTLVGYFNSLRELGGTRRLVEDDVPARMKVLARRDRQRWPYRDLYSIEELTSNKTAEQIPQVLNRLERRFPQGKPESGHWPIDVLLASNMISVGVDIDRLGLMVVNGQPKTTAEYIQATSRIGRQTPGLIITVYNWTRPRDISHYERFRSYHATLYRFVEATSVTPYSSRARDKGLEAILTALIRLAADDMSHEQAAGNIDSRSSVAQSAITLLTDRARRVVGDDAALATAAEARARLDEWAAAAHSPLCYTDRGIGKDTHKRYLLGPSERDNEGIFDAPGSLREVEGELFVYLANQGGS